MKKRRGYSKYNNITIPSTAVKKFREKKILCRICIIRICRMFDRRSASNKGLRQGCNLSLVFTLYMVGLSNFYVGASGQLNSVRPCTTNFKQRGPTKDTGSNTNNLFSIYNMLFNFSHNLRSFNNKLPINDRATAQRLSRLLKESLLACS